MTINRSWAAYHPTYRAEEMEILARWLLAGESGSVVGLPGCGRSNLLGFFSHRPDALQSYLPPNAPTIVIVPIEFNDLLKNDLSIFYRIILRAFYRVLDHLEANLQQVVSDIYEKHRTEQDFFVAQEALYELLKHFHEAQIQVVLVFNRFEDFFENATLQMLNALRGVRDNYKDTLCFIIGMPQAVSYLPNPRALGNLYELFDSHVCWVGPMNRADALQLVAQEMRAAPQLPTDEEIDHILALTGHFPALLKAICHWWLTEPNRPPAKQWESTLLDQRSVQHRLLKIWNSLTQEEQLVLSELQKLLLKIRSGGKNKQPRISLQNLIEQNQQIFSELTAKGVCCSSGEGWDIRGMLLTGYIAEMAGRGRGKIWLNEYGEIYQGQVHLKDLTDLERSVLAYLIEHPYERHTKTDLIINTWPDELRRQGVSDESLFTLIAQLRRKIEPDTAAPCYIINWRGKPEGGYQLFPEGRPR